MKRLHQNLLYPSILILVLLVLMVSQPTFAQDERWKSLYYPGKEAIQQGRYPEAEKLLVAARDEARLKFPTNRRLALTLAMLGYCYTLEAKYELAREAFEEAQRHTERALTEVTDSADKRLLRMDLAANLNNLGDLARTMEDPGKAEPLLRRSLEILEEEVGSTHHELATKLNNLGLVYHDLGKYADSESCYKRALTIKHTEFGSHSIEVATTLNNLGVLYGDQGRYVEAEPIWKEALAIFEWKRGKDHPDVAWPALNLAVLYHKLRRPKEAELLFLRALRIREGALGPSHPDVAQVLLDYAALLNEDPVRRAEAAEMRTRAKAIVGEQRLKTPRRPPSDQGAPTIPRP